MKGSFRVAAFLCGAFLAFGFRAEAELSFVQLTDPHLFGKEAGNERAFRQCVEEINRRWADGGELRFVVVTGDLGIEDLVSDKPTDGGERKPRDNWAKDCERGAGELAEIIAPCAVKRWLFLPGNNDLIDEDPDTLKYYTDFVQILHEQLKEKGFQIINLTPSGNDDLSSGVYTEGAYTFIGFNNASFKSNDKFADASAWTNDHNIAIAGIKKRVEFQDVNNAYIFFHIPEVDDPFYVFDASNERLDKWFEGRGPFAESRYKYSAWTVPDKTHKAWENVVEAKQVKGLFAGHFHDWRRATYCNFRWLRTDCYSSGTLLKLHICPPLAEKRQITTPAQARGFQIVHIDDAGKPNVEIVWYNAASFSAEEPARGNCHSLEKTTMVAGDRIGAHTKRCCCWGVAVGLLLLGFIAGAVISIVARRPEKGY